MIVVGGVRVSKRVSRAYRSSAYICLCVRVGVFVHAHVFVCVQTMGVCRQRGARRVSVITVRARHKLCTWLE